MGVDNGHNIAEVMIQPTSLLFILLLVLIEPIHPAPDSGLFPLPMNHISLNHKCHTVIIFEKTNLQLLHFVYIGQLSATVNWQEGNQLIFCYG